MRFVFLLCLVVLSPRAFSEETVYALLACDTLSDLKPASEQDLANLKTALQEIAQYSELKAKIHVLANQALTSANIENWLSMAEKVHEGVVLFYYSGHGFRTQSLASSFPYLTFPSRHECYNPDDLLCRLIGSSARLVIIIFDCCNSTGSNPGSFTRALPKYGGPLLTPPGYKILFSGSQGRIVAVGSAPGEPAFAYSTGSLYTNSLLQALRSECMTSDATWQRIFDRAAALCAPTQHPYFILNVSVMPQEQKRARQAS